MPALRLVWQSSPRWTMTMIVLLVINSILPLLSIYLSKLIIDTFATGVGATHQSAVFSHVLVLVFFLGIIAIASIIFNSLGELVYTAQSQQVTDYMQNILHRKSMQVDLEYYENAEYYDTLQRAQNEAPYRPSQILSRLIALGHNSISLVAMLSLLLSLHWGIGIILFVAAIPPMLVRIKYSHITYLWER